MPYLSKYTTHLPSCPSRKQEAPFIPLIAPCSTESSTSKHTPDLSTHCSATAFRPLLKSLPVIYLLLSACLRMHACTRARMHTHTCMHAHTRTHARHPPRSSTIYLHHVLSKLSFPVPTHTSLNSTPATLTSGAPQTYQAPPCLRVFVSAVPHP